MASPFIDTNVAVYILSADPGRASRADAILQSGGIVSVQVLNEFATVARGKYKLPWNEIQRALGLVRAAVEVRDMTLETHERGLRIAERYGFRVYDSILLAAALEAGCDTFWSEDLHDGQVIDGSLTIRNPFKP